MVCAEVQRITRSRDECLKQQMKNRDRMGEMAQTYGRAVGTLCRLQPESQLSAGNKVLS